MDKITKLEAIKKELQELKSKDPKRLEEATKGVVEIIKKHPEINEDKDLKLMIAYSIVHMNESKVFEIVDKAFTPIVGQFEFLNVKRDSKSTLSYLFVSLNNILQRLERSHVIYVLKKSNPRKVQIAKRNSDGNLVEIDGVVVKEERYVQNLTLWIDDMKMIASIVIWGSKNGEELSDEFTSYQILQPTKGYKMMLNYNGQVFFPPKDPMITPIENFKPNFVEMVKFIVEKFPKMQEPFDAPGNMEIGKSFWMIGKISKDATGGSIFIPAEPTTYIIQIMNSPDSRQLEEGNDVLILGNIGKSKGFIGRDNKEIKPLSDFTIFPLATIKLTLNEDVKNEDVRNDDVEEKIDMKSDLEL